MSVPRGWTFTSNLGNAAADLVIPGIQGVTHVLTSLTAHIYGYGNPNNYAARAYIGSLGNQLLIVGLLYVPGNSQGGEISEADWSGELPGLANGDLTLTVPNGGLANAYTDVTASGYSM